VTAAPRRPVHADPDAVRRAADSLRDAVRDHGPAALIPAAHGRLATAVRCLATAAQVDPATPASVRALLAEVRLAVAELDAYDAARPPRRAAEQTATPPAAASRDGRPATSPPGLRSPQVRTGAGPEGTGDY
jgi:hypothetical protein